MSSQPVFIPQSAAPSTLLANPTAPTPIARPPQPVFASVEDERRHRKQKLAAAFRIFSKLGFQEGVMGHFSVRDPEKTDHYWANPYATDFGSIKASDLVLYNFDGQIVEGNTRFIHRGNTVLHIPILKTRPDVIAAAHTHSVHGRAWSSLGRLLDPLSAESSVFYQKHAIYDSYEHGEGYTLANAIGENRALLLKNHGILTVGQSVDEAAYLFISMEKAAQAQLLAEAVGTPQRINHQHAEEISQRFQPYIGWLNFQPMFQSIVREQPDLLD
jgi:ribulose-5-phosphate 4-epimerase/fuculose-1-phosphate aldolase